MAPSRIAGLVFAASFLGASVAAAHPGPHHFEPPAPRAGAPKVDPAKRRWLAGDHHVHSWFSVGWAPSADGTSAPSPIKAGDASNPIPTNATMGLNHGLSWMVSTDHGGPNHSKINRDQAYPELLRSRREHPGLIHFFGMELDVPGAEHASLILPRTRGERDDLFGIESRFNRREPWPADPARNSEALMLDALKHMGSIEAPPVVIANHPSRTATAVGAYGLVSPGELRNWNDTAPHVAVGMEGAPGHQAASLNTKKAADPDDAFRGSYHRAPTMGGFDQMTARLGGFWDSMLGEGRNWWVTSTSDSHRHYTEGGNDFWPGEYSKTYVKAVRTYDDVLDGLRHGRVFVTLGDLVSELDVMVQPASGGARAEIGGRLRVPRGSDVTVVIRLRDPAGANFGGRTPDVRRVDLIRGEITGAATDRSADRNPSTRIEARFGPGQWARDGERISIAYTLRNVTQSTYVRVRGTNGTELEPEPDVAGEDPWTDLWFYANPVFIEVEG